jgi:hypothetical protein
MMPTVITVGSLIWLLRLIFAVMARVTSVVSLNGFLRLPHKSAGKILAAAFETASPISQRPKS